MTLQARLERFFHLLSYLAYGLFGLLVSFMLAFYLLQFEVWLMIRLASH
jgi:hypothetical protein